MNSKPFTFGIPRSATITSGTSASRLASACAAECAAVTRAADASSTSETSDNASSSSSTTRTCRWLRSAIADSRRTASDRGWMRGSSPARGCTIISGIFSRNVAPVPGPSLAASIVPPCISASCRAIERPSPSPPCSPRHPGVGLAEALEDVRQKLGAMPMPVSLTTDFDVRVDPLQPHLHPAALGRELDGVRQEVPDDLLQPSGSPEIGVACGSTTVVHADALRVGGRRDGVDGAARRRRGSRPVGRSAGSSPR